MGKSKGAYIAEFPVGTWVRVVELEKLKEFETNWKWHHPLEPSQKEFAGNRGQVEDVNYYHSSDELNVIKNIPCIWHEVYLELTQTTNKLKNNDQSPFEGF